MQWLETSDVKTKLAAVFLYLNNGGPISAANMSVLLKFVYPQCNEVCRRLFNELISILLFRVN